MISVFQNFKVLITFQLKLMLWILNPNLKIKMFIMDVTIKLFVLSLEEGATIWFRNLNDNNIKNWDDFSNTFIEYK